MGLTVAFCRHFITLPDDLFMACAFWRKVCRNVYNSVGLGFGKISQFCCCIGELLFENILWKSIIYMYNLIQFSAGSNDDCWSTNP